MIEFLLKLLPGIVIAIVTAWFTVRFSLKRFYAEKWWERKYQAYERLIHAMYDVRHYAAEYERDEMDQDYEIPKEKEADMVERSRQAIEILNKELVIGEFLFSSDTVSHLRELRKQLDEAGTHVLWAHHLKLMKNALDTAIPSIVRCAHVELRATRI
jgi:hypothetical protein